MTLSIGDPRQQTTDAAIVDRVIAAVMEQKLSAGAKLPEFALCEAFDCNRTQIRRVLVVLAERGAVTLHPNRGAFVSRPTAAEARDIFEARRVIEQPLALAAAIRAQASALAELRDNVVATAAAETRGLRGESIRLSGEFHLRLAEIAGNAVLQKFMEELVTRTSLIIGLYGSRHSRSCSEEEHGALLDALEARDGAKAAEQMTRHLDHIERDLRIRDALEESVDIRRIFGA